MDRNSVERKIILFWAISCYIVIFNDLHGVTDDNEFEDVNITRPTDYNPSSDGGSNWWTGTYQKALCGNKLYLLNNSLSSVLFN